MAAMDRGRFSELAVYLVEQVQDLDTDPVIAPSQRMEACCVTDWDQDHRQSSATLDNPL